MPLRQGSRFLTATENLRARRRSTTENLDLRGVKSVIGMSKPTGRGLGRSGVNLSESENSQAGGLGRVDPTASELLKVSFTQKGRGTCKFFFENEELAGAGLLALIRIAIKLGGRYPGCPREGEWKEGMGQRPPLLDGHHS